MPKQPPQKQPPKKTTPSSPSSLARPDIKKLRAKEELRDDKTDKSPDTGPADPKLRRNREGECPHGRVFSCVRCGKDKAAEEKKEDERERKESLIAAVRQFHRSTFNIVALITGDKDVRLNAQEEQALGDSGTACMMSAAPEISIPTIHIAGYVVTLGGVITEKILNSESESDGKSPKTDRGGKADGKDDAGAQVPTLRLPAPRAGTG